jgi:hypothetical protein
MAFDLSWLWNIINSIVSAVQSWFQSLWSEAQNITNTGQGLFAGLVALGAQLWDAITKAFNTIGEWFYNAFNWIYSGFKYVADTFGSWLSNAISWIGSGISWVAQQIYNFGNWLYNGIVFVWNWIVNALTALWNALTSWFSGITNTLSSWWSNVVTGINTWFTSLLKVFRQKIIQTITADIAIAGAWKAGERILHSQSLKDVGYGLLGILASPLVGALIGGIVDSVVPSPATSTYPLIPDITPLTYTPPSIVIEKPVEKPPPSIGVTPTPPAVGAGLPYDLTLGMPSAPTYDCTTVSTDKSLTMPSTTYDTALSTTDNSLRMPSITYEYETS